MFNDMKKVFMFLALLVGFVSCNSEVESMQNGTVGNEELVNKQTVYGDTLDPIIFEFEADVLESNLQIEMTNWETTLDNRDFEGLTTYQNSINVIFNGLYEKYGHAEVIGYIEILDSIEVKGEHDGSPCTRNENGTIYLGACSFWGKVKFYLSFKCSGLGEIAETEEQINEYFDCLQGNICDICS